MNVNKDDCEFLIETMDAIKTFPKSTRCNTRHLEDLKISFTKENVCVGAIHSFRTGSNIAKNTFNPKLEKLQRTLLTLAKLYIPDFRFSSIQINKNFNSSVLHVDNNIGPSFTLSVGDFTGGQLYVHKKGLLTTKERLVRFNGQNAHIVLPYEGKRYSFIFFTNVSFLKLSEERKEHLKELGYPIPNDNDLKEYVEESREIRSIKPKLRLEIAREQMPESIRAIEKAVLPDGTRGSVTSRQLYKKQKNQF